MEKISRPDHVRNGEVLQRVKQEEYPTNNEKKNILTALVTYCTRLAIGNMLVK